MDPVALIFYAAVCGLLSLAAPGFKTPAMRLIVGAVVGVAAASLLPVLRGFL
ncbi:hypothetical protein [Pseudoruegeria sp. SHC-113]|uniref:hypothetical protein n=1 Tax=Pseudoruegeria sp. SHC-113 TaxID=2855439 RepID=UPI0021BA3CE8|nr:hypothetical protein [Pseudoruegeria sp. SHC-113]MCT8159146.1 hypothetical protein [Pseudoruegeria sp. SHC-113]